MVVILFPTFSIWKECMCLDAPKAKSNLDEGLEMECRWVNGLTKTLARAICFNKCRNSLVAVAFLNFDLCPFLPLFSLLSLSGQGFDSFRGRLTLL